MNGRRIAAVMVFLCLGTPVMAIDVGDPVYYATLGERENRLEMIYESYDRDIVAQDVEITVPGVGVFEEGGEIELGGADVDIIALRFTGLTMERAAIYGTVGILDADDVEGTPYLVGIGGRVIIHEGQALNLSLVGAFNYVPEIKSEYSDFDPDLGGQGTAEEEKEFYEAAVGLILSGVAGKNERLAVIPYAGILASIIRGDGDAKVSYPDGDFQVSADFEEDEIPVGVAGVSLVFDKSVSVRGEARFLGDSSFSVGVGAAF